MPMSFSAMFSPRRRPHDTTCVKLFAINFPTVYTNINFLHLIRYISHGKIIISCDMGKQIVLKLESRGNLMQKFIVIKRFDVKTREVSFKAHHLGNKNEERMRRF